MTRASDLARLIGAGGTVANDVTISEDSPSIKLNDTDTSRFIDILYGTRNATFRNTMASGEDMDTVAPEIIFSTKDDGETREHFRMNKSEAVFNEGGADLDFRVESDVNPHAFVVDAEEGDIFINGSAFASGANRKQFEINASATALRSGCSATTTQFHEEFHNPNGTVGSISTSGSGTNFNETSDYRLKENVTYTFDATTRLKQLKPSRFNFKADANITVDGFLAHEVSSIVPEAVTGEKDAVDSDGNIVAQSIDKAKLVPLLVKTIQELEARITALESK